MITYSIIQKSQLEGAKRLDAEYYQPEYLELINRLLNTKSYKFWKDIKGKFITGPFGSEFNVENYVKNSNYRYIRGKDVKEFFVLGNDNVYIPENDFMRLKKYALQEGDILISVVGTLGNVAIIDRSIPPAIYSCKSTNFRTKEINTYYLLAYLNSKYGRKLLEQNTRGALQTGLNIDDLKSLLIFIPSVKKQNIIASLVIDARKALNDFESLYSQAENFLLEELKISETDFDNQLSCIVNLSEAKSANRFDAEYFEPKHKILESRIKNHESRKLGDIVSIKKGIEPGAESYLEEGKQFIRVSSLSKYEISDSEQKYLNKELYNKLKADYQPQKGEILLTKDASPGIAYVLKENIEGIISSGILRLKLKNKEIEDEYLALCLNSIIGKMQAQRDAGGSVIMHWKPEEIKNVIIPILSKPIQQKISSLVRQSFESRKKSKQFLEEAKRKVEEMIEKS